ncbi:hypothetical protein K0M31_016944 [Melipona bicolor]|uniref:Uncharacterized protein n=1 Tax=Melipona bicolor TaxID=60889 RepID=A0AA40FDR8_9HYME|nr:hypothetical protein K0M31_016944 [Melipona bicolor]
MSLTVHRLEIDQSDLEPDGLSPPFLDSYAYQEIPLRRINSYAVTALKASTGAFTSRYIDQE